MRFAAQEAEPRLDISAAFANLCGTHALAIEQRGALALANPAPGEIDDARLRDVLLYVEYVLA